jgi:hypothetical protein
MRRSHFQRGAHRHDVREACIKIEACSGGEEDLEIVSVLQGPLTHQPPQFQMWSRLAQERGWRANHTGWVCGWATVCHLVAFASGVLTASYRKKIVPVCVVLCVEGGLVVK